MRVIKTKITGDRRRTPQVILHTYPAQTIKNKCRERDTAEEYIVFCQAPV